MITNGVDKWSKHRIFPLQLLLHIIGFLMILSLVIIMNSTLSTFYRLNKETFGSLFLQDKQKALAVDEFLNHLKTVVYHYYKIKDLTIQHFTYKDSTDPPPLSMEIGFKGGRTENWNLTESEYFGQYTESEPRVISEFLEDVEEMKIEFDIVTVLDYDPEADGNRTWLVTLTYDMKSSFMKIGMSVYRLSVPASTFNTGAILNFCVVAMCVCSMLGSVERFIRVLLIRERTIRRFNAIEPERLRKRFLQMGINPPPRRWGHIPLSVRLEFFSMWAIFSFLGDTLIVSSSLMGLFTNMRGVSQDTERILFAIGVLITTSRLTEYLEYFPNFYTLLLTLKFSFGKMIRYILSILPLLFGFIILGVILFAPYSEDFEDFGAALSTLFSLVNADDVHADFRDLQYTYPLGRTIPAIFLSVFMVLFIAAILNVFIFIINDAFHLAKLVSAKVDKEYENLPGTIIAMYESEWLAIQKKLDLEKLYLALDGEYYKIDDNNIKQYVPTTPQPKNPPSAVLPGSLVNIQQSDNQNTPYDSYSQSKTLPEIRNVTSLRRTLSLRSNDEFIEKMKLQEQDIKNPLMPIIEEDPKKKRPQSTHQPNSLHTGGLHTPRKSPSKSKQRSVSLKKKRTEAYEQLEKQQQKFLEAVETSRMNFLNNLREELEEAAKKKKK